MPKDSKDSTKLNGWTTLTFILKRNDSIGYYEGLSKEIRFTRFGSMRTLIQQKQISLAKNRNLLTLIIKPTKESSYKNFIDAMDEVYINNCRHYFIAEPEKNDLL